MEAQDRLVGRGDCRWPAKSWKPRVRIPAASFVRVCSKRWPSKAGGRREDRMLVPPVGMRRKIATGVTGATRPSLRNGLRLIRALLGVPAFQPPSPCESTPQDLIPASGDQDHTTSLVRDGCLRRRSFRCAGHPHVHRIPRPALV